MVLLIQVPLKQKEIRPPSGVPDDTGVFYCSAPLLVSDVEAAVIGHGDVEGPFTEIDGLDIERDDRYPIRVLLRIS